MGVEDFRQNDPNGFPLETISRYGFVSIVILEGVYFSRKIIMYGCVSPCMVATHTGGMGVAIGSCEMAEWMATLCRAVSPKPVAK